jgi:hypothetical protein
MGSIGAPQKADGSTSSQKRVFLSKGPCSATFLPYPWLSKGHLEQMPMDYMYASRTKSERCKYAYGKKCFREAL